MVINTETLSGARRFFHHKLQANVVKVHGGDVMISQRPDEALMTILGSCIAACIRDVKLGLGGMNHFMLPSSGKGYADTAVVSQDRIYGTNAMELLINALLKEGCRKTNLEVKVFGGADFSQSLVGQSNIDFIERYLMSESLRVAAKDLGGNKGRRIFYFPKTGRTLRFFVEDSKDQRDVVQEEIKLQQRLKTEKPKDDIELF